MSKNKNKKSTRSTSAPAPAPVPPPLSELEQRRAELGDKDCRFYAVWLVPVPGNEAAEGVWYGDSSCWTVLEARLKGGRLFGNGAGLKRTTTLQEAHSLATRKREKKDEISFFRIHGGVSC